MERKKNLIFLAGLLSILFITLPVKAYALPYGVTGSISLPKLTSSVDIVWDDAASHLLFVAEKTNGRIDVINTTTDSFITTIACAPPNGVVYAPDTKTIWAGANNHLLV